MSRNPWLIALVLSAAGLQVACTTLVCGKGTVEKDNECVSTGGLPIGGNCGPGTRLVSGECRSSLVPDDGGTPPYCGDNTKVVVVDGIPTCVGVGGMVNCNQAIACPTPTTGKIAVCGRIYDIQTTKPIDDGLTMTGPSNDVSVSFYEPLGFAGDPSHTLPLLTIHPGPNLDSCGRYAAIVPYQATGFIAVAVDDEGTTNDNYRLTGVAAGEPAAGGTLEGLDAYATLVTTDMMWTMSSGSSGPDPALGGMTFAEHGVYVPIYVDTKLPNPAYAPLQGTPTMGVTITAGGTADATRDFYFSDMDPLTRTTVGPALNSTGVNGSGLFINGALMMYSGMGMEPSGCIWPSSLAATPAGVVFVSERNSQVSGGGACM